jgi:hypothetical protein
MGVGVGVIDHVFSGRQVEDAERRNVYRSTRQYTYEEEKDKSNPGKETDFATRKR